MGRSTTLRDSDYRTLIRIIGECRDHGADPIAWQLHLLGRLCDVVGAKVGASGEFEGVERGLFIPLSAVDRGWDNEAQRKPMYEWFERQAACGARSGLLPPGPWARNGVATVIRRDVIGDGEWYRSEPYSDYLRRSELDDLVVSFERIPRGRGLFFCVTVFRERGERQFARRDARFVEALQRELVPMIGRQLASADAPSANQLSPRLRSLLDCLLEGDGEKQAALRLGLSRQTVNQYVKQIYRHFHVNSRAELMAHWIRFARGGAAIGAGGRAAAPANPA